MAGGGKAVIRAGELRDQVVLQKSIQSLGRQGGRTFEWEDQYTVWAAVAPITGSEYAEASQMQAKLTHVVTIRQKSDVKSGWRVKFGARFLNIESVQDVEVRSRRMVLLCSESRE